MRGTPLLLQHLRKIRTARQHPAEESCRARHPENTTPARTHTRRRTDGRGTATLYHLECIRRVETEGVFIAHASIHGNTAAAAERLAEILKEKGCPKVAVSDLCRDDLGEAIEDAFRYGKMICMASSYDAGVFPPMYDFLHHLEIKAYQKRRVGLVENGSWAPSAAKTMRAMIEGMKQVEIIEPVVTLRGKMKQADIPLLESLAEAIL